MESNDLGRGAKRALWFYRVSKESVRILWLSVCMKLLMDEMSDFVWQTYNAIGMRGNRSVTPHALHYISLSLSLSSSFTITTVNNILFIDKTNITWLMPNITYTTHHSPHRKYSFYFISILYHSNNSRNRKYIVYYVSQSLRIMFLSASSVSVAELMNARRVFERLERQRVRLRS